MFCLYNLGRHRSKKKGLQNEKCCSPSMLLVADTEKNPPDYPLSSGMGMLPVGAAIGPPL